MPAAFTIHCLTPPNPWQTAKKCYPDYSMDDVRLDEASPVELLTHDEIAAVTALEPVFAEVPVPVVEPVLEPGAAPGKRSSQPYRPCCQPPSMRRSSSPSACRSPALTG